MQVWDPKSSRRLAIFAALVACFFFGLWWMYLRMPGRAFMGHPPPLDERELALRKALRNHVFELSDTIGVRQYHSEAPEKLVEAADYLVSTLEQAGLRPRRLGYRVGGESHDNIEVEIAGSSRADEIVVVGAHYDSPTGSPGANDNASGVSAMLELAKRFAVAKPQRTLRFVGFVNEEPWFFKTAQMGSLVYARACRERGDDIVAMISLETIGFYTDEPDSQLYPMRLLDLLYPDTGDFVSFLANSENGSLVRNTIRDFRRQARIPSEGLVALPWLQGMDWSDHWSFWQQGYPGIVVTDTAPYRYEHYHSPEDTLDKLDFDDLARVTYGLEAVVEGLANP